MSYQESPAANVAEAGRLIREYKMRLEIKRKLK
jgi:hypothetical protein